MKKAIIIIILICSFLFGAQASYAQNSTSCTGLNLEFVNHGSSYTAGETVTYKYSCSPGGYASYIEIQVVKPDGTATTYNTASGGIDTNTFGFATSNLAAGNYIVRACFNQNCQPSATASLPFTIVAAATSTPSSTSIGNQCASGSIPGNGACNCGGVTYNTGYCCNNVYSSSPSVQCSSVAPQCSEGSVPSSGCICSGYAYTSGYCCRSGLQSGLVWSGNTPCTQTCPTIAKSVSYSYNGVCCSGSGSDCKGTWSGQWGIDCQGYTCCIGTAQPLCTGSVYGDGAPSPTPTPSLTPGTGAPEPSNNDPGVWAQVDTSTGQISTTAVCTKSVCGLNGEWHGYVPPASYATGSVWWPTSKRYIWQMSGQAGYSSGTFNFNTYVFTVQGGTIYNGQFTPTSTSTANQTQTNYNSTPSAYNPTYTPFSTYTITPTYLPTTYPTPWINIKPESSICFSDQECSWEITNSCPESSGANWECRRTGNSVSIEQLTCPKFLSPRPSANCGCIQGSCIVFENEKPKEISNKIGNTEVDTTALLSVVIQMEQLKVKFDFLKSSMLKLSKYHNITRNYEASSRWFDASNMLNNTILKLDTLKEGIRSKIYTFNIDDLRQLKSDIKSVIGTLKEIVGVILGANPTSSPKSNITSSPSLNETPIIIITTPSLTIINETPSVTIPSPSPILSASPTLITAEPKSPVTFSTKIGTYNWQNWNPDLRATVNYSEFNITKVEYYFKRLSDNNYFSPAGLIGSPQFRYWSPNQTIYSNSQDNSITKTKHILMQISNKSLTQGDYEFGVKFTRQDGVNTDWVKTTYNFESIPEKYALLKTPISGQQIKIGSILNILGQCLGDLPQYKCPLTEPNCDTSTWSIYFREKQTNGNWTDFRYPYITRKVQFNGTCNYQWTVPQPQDCEKVTVTSSTGTSTSYRCTSLNMTRDSQLMLSIYPSCMTSSAYDVQARCIGEKKEIINITLVPNN